MKKRMMIILLSIIVIIAIICFMIDKKRNSGLLSVPMNEGDRYLDNPARGFYIQVQDSEKERLEQIRKEGNRIILLSYGLRHYIDQKISDEKLKKLEDMLEEAERLGIQVVFRAAYDFGQGGETVRDIDLVLTHINQIAEVLNEHKQTVLAVQAGFIGKWGEWHGDQFFTGDQNEIRIRNLILKEELEQLDSSIVVNVRRPKFIRDAVDAGLDSTRLGFHNDGLLASESDLGTYPTEEGGREEGINWLSRNIVTGINGGEIPAISSYTHISNAAIEFRKLKMTYLNRGYNTEALEQWKEQRYGNMSGMEYMERYLGYRFYLQEFQCQKVMRKSGEFEIRGVLVNRGFAPIRSGYQMYLVIERGYNRQFVTIPHWNLQEIAGGEEKHFDIKVQVDDSLFEPGEKLYWTNKDLKIGICIARSGEDGIPIQVDAVRLANEGIFTNEGISYVIGMDADVLEEPYLYI